MRSGSTVRDVAADFVSCSGVAHRTSYTVEAAVTPINKRVSYENDRVSPADSTALQGNAYVRHHS